MSDAVWITLLANLATIVIAVATFFRVMMHGRRQKRMYRKIDGRMKKLVSLQAGKAKAEGKMEMLEHPPAGLAVVPMAPPAPPIPPAPPVP